MFSSSFDMQNPFFITMRFNNEVEISGEKTAAYDETLTLCCVFFKLDSEMRCY